MSPCQTVYSCKSDPAYKRLAVQKSRRAKVFPRAKESPCKSVPSCKNDPACKRVAVQNCPRAKVSSRAKMTRSHF